MDFAEAIQKQPMDLLIFSKARSGDLGKQDADGRIFIAGRFKDLIIRSGHNIDPAMIENLMTDHPAFAVAAAVGKSDAYAGVLLGPDR